MTKGRWLLAVIILVAVGLATAQGLRPHPPPPVEVSTATVKRQDLTRTVNAAGHVQARETVKVSSNVTGDLLSLSVKEGDRVTRGQVLGQIDKRVAELKPWLGHLALIALEFPKFRDGRAYSQARLLREQYGFRGTLRATGDVLRDQFQFLVRAGFDSFDVKKPADAAAFAKSVARFSVVYQPGADGSLPALRRRLQSAGTGKPSETL